MKHGKLVEELPAHTGGEWCWISVLLWRNSLVKLLKVELDAVRHCHRYNLCTNDADRFWHPMADSSSDLTPLGRRLSDLSVDVSNSDSPATWKDVETTAQALANGLRVRDGPGKDPTLEPPYSVNLSKSTTIPHWDRLPSHKLLRRFLHLLCMEHRFLPCRTSLSCSSFSECRRICAWIMASQLPHA
jgi:hypothetical protein